MATYWMTIEQKENFEDYAVYTVEIPTKEQNTPECNEAKHKEIENLVKFDVFEEVDDVGQERISSRWVVTQKEKADGQHSAGVYYGTRCNFCPRLTFLPIFLFILTPPYSFLMTQNIPPVFFPHNKTKIVS